MSRRQLLAIGMTLGQIEARLVAGVWCHSGLPGVYVAFTGPVGFLSRCWAALLYAGPGCVLCLETAAWVWGLRDDTPPTVDVMIPTTRRVVAQPGMRVHLRVAVGRRRHPVRQSPVTSVEETVIDLVEVSQTGADAIDVVIRACQRRLTTAARLLATAELRKKMCRRALLLDVLSDVVEGVLSALERRWLRDVERAHGLPRGSRNRPEGRSGRRRYRDVHYREYRLIVELDGAAAHPEETRERDFLRDNEMLEDGIRTVRYGWRSVAHMACESAGQTARLLRAGGWAGTPRRCGPACRLTWT